MSKNMICSSIAFIVLLICTSSAPVEHGYYAQLVPGSSKKFVFQMVPDKTYTHVVAYMNFYSSDNKRVGQKAYSITDEKDKTVPKDKCTTRIFKFSFDKSVSRVTVDHVNEGETLDKDEKPSKVGKKINLSQSDKALAPID
jgi:hypothetical protein